MFLRIWGMRFFIMMGEVYVFDIFSVDIFFIDGVIFFKLELSFIGFIEILYICFCRYRYVV